VIQRTAWLDCYEVQGAGIGMTEEALQEHRRADEEAIPFHDVGIFVRAVNVWAVKEA
jgi:predicted GNAT family acetyltransferase